MANPLNVSPEDLERRSPRQTRQPTRRRARLALGFVVISLIALVAVPYWIGARTQAIRQELRRVIEPARAEADRMTTRFDREVTALRGYRITGDSSYLDRYRTLSRERAEASARLLPLLQRLGPAGPALLQQFHRAAAEWEATHGGLVLAGLPADAVTGQMETSERELDIVIAAGDRLETYLREETSARRERIQDEEGRGVVLSAVLALLALAAALVVADISHRLRIYGRQTERLYRESRELAIELRQTVEDLRRAKDAAEEANHAKSEFLATMSHELRTPLNAIIGYAELIEMGIPEQVPEASRAHVGRIGESARHLLSIIEEILTYSSVEGRQEYAAEEVVDVRGLVRTVVEMIEPLARKKGLRLSADLKAAPDAIWSDPRKLRQILVNLIGNAIKFTQTGTVEVSVLQEDGDLIFRVRDTGIGIRPEHLPQVFAPFWQVDQSHTRPVGGTGLGLTVSRSLARLLGGDITAESVPGEGSTFDLRLPVRTAALPQSA